MTESKWFPETQIKYLKGQYRYLSWDKSSILVDLGAPQLLSKDCLFAFSSCNDLVLVNHCVFSVFVGFFSCNFHFFPFRYNFLNINVIFFFQDGLNTSGESENDIPKFINDNNDKTSYLRGKFLGKVKTTTNKTSVAEPKLFICGSDFVHNFGSGSSSSFLHILAL